MLWWGIWLIACSVGSGYATVYAPLFITLLIRYVSGVPLLEAKYAENLEFQAYCRETNVFIPWFVTEVDSKKDGEDNDLQMVGR